MLPKYPMRFAATLATLAALATGASPARAWGNEGHEIIALIAENYLAPATRAAVDHLLADDHDSLTATDIASRATWADAYRETHPETGQWHYIDIETDDGDVARACARTVCIVRALSLAEHQLADASQPEASRIFALKMVLHLAGDIHQPLHAADDHDHGGNCERISTSQSSWLPTRANVSSLHAYWDTGTVRSLGRQPAVVAVALRRSITDAEVIAWQQGSIADWARETYRLAVTAAYPGAGPPGCSSHAITALSHSYQRRAVAVTAIQLERAGIRLATILNRALPGTPR